MELDAQYEAVVFGLAKACHDGNLTDFDGPSFAPLRTSIVDVSLARALKGFSAKETATFILSIKAPLFARLRAVLAAEPERLAAETLTIGDLIDALALFMMETFQRTREKLSHRQQTEISKLSTPVVKLWQGILAVPLIGTLDTARNQLLMENLQGKHRPP